MSWKIRTILNTVYAIPMLGWIYVGWQFDEIVMLYLYLILIDVAVYQRDWGDGEE